MAVRKTDDFDRAREFFSVVNDKLCICDERCPMFKECETFPDVCETCNFIFQNIDEWITLAQQKAKEQ